MCCIEARYVDEYELTLLFNGEPSSDEIVVTEKHVPNKASLDNHSVTCSSFNGGGETVTILPSTTLQYCGDTPQPRVETAFDRSLKYRSCPQYANGCHVRS
jgi:hypothetical protein